MNKILEFCEFKEHETLGMAWIAPDGIQYINSTLNTRAFFDMNFFFKYVVPKLGTYTIEMSINKFGVEVWLLNMFDKKWHFSDADPNEAWQEALLKLIEERQNG